MTITELSIKRPALITMLFLALGVMGIFGYSKLGVDLLPKMDFPFVSVITVYPGAGPEEIENLISKPIEEAVAGTNKLDNVRSISSEGVSVVLGQYLLTAKADEVAGDVQRRVDLIRNRLPKDAQSPKIIKNDINAAPIIRMSMTSTVLTPTEAYQFAKDKIKPRLEATAGVAQVDITGGREREIRVSVDNDKLRSYNMSILQVSQALQRENLDFPTGKVSEPQNEYLVRVAGKFKSTAELENLPLVALPTGSTVYLRDVARVTDTYKEDARPTRLNSTDAIGLLLIKQSDANSTQTADLVYGVVKKLEEEYKGEGIKIEIAQDVTTFTRHSLEEVMRDLLIAVFMVSAVLFLFLRSGRNALIVMLSIPTSLITTFFFMWMFGFTLNLMSTMALALVIGILVDDSIVVLENIHRKLEAGLSPMRAAIEGRNEIGFAALAITLVDVVVFLPISLVEGMAGKIFREFGLTVVTATLLSLLVSFTLTPLLAAKFGRAHEAIKFKPFRWLTDKFEAFQDMLVERYRNILGWSLKHRWVIVTSSFLLFIASCAPVFMGLIPGEFITPPDRGEFAANYEFPSGTNIRTADSLIKIYEGRLDSHPEVARYLTITGKQENPWGSVERASVGQIQVKLRDKHVRKISTNEVMNQVTELAQGVPGLKINTQPIGIFGTANQAPIQIEIRGDSIEKLTAFGNELIRRAKGMPGLKDFKSTYEEGQPEVKVHFDRDRLALYQMSLEEAAAGMRNAFAGNQDTKYKEGETEFDINVIIDKVDRSNARDVSQILLMNRLGQTVKLSDVADIYYGKGPTQINRKNRERNIMLTGGLDGAALGTVVTQLQHVIDSMTIPKGMNAPYFAGDAENQQRSGGDMGVAMLLAILFVYMIMVALFESYAHPFTIMFSLPVSLIGALFFLLIFGKTLSLFTMVGLIMLMGLVTKNAILIVDRANAQRALGHGVHESLLEAGPTRLRPIIMTTSTMILGMLPLASGWGEGAEMRSGMAIAIIGGLISSMLLSLVLVPVMYTFVEGAREKFPRFFRRINIFSKMRKPRPAYVEAFEPALANGSPVTRKATHERV